MRIVIAGVPRAGKSALADWVSLDTGLIVQRTDSLIKHDWSDASLLASTWFNSPHPSIVEGVAVPRALRKWLARSSGAPADVVLWLDTPRIELTPGQATMAAGCRSVWAEILPELLARRVKVERV